MTGSKPTAPRSIRHTDDLSEFDCGVATLDQWLRRRALPNESGGVSRTFVSCAQERVVGYYSLAAGSIIHSVATTRTRRNAPDPVPAVVLGRLAVDHEWRGVGLGASLLGDAVLRVVSAAGAIGVRAMLVHAISDEAKSFYQRFGFVASPVEPLTMMITVEDLRRQVDPR
ncbi:MAG: GNAT family N-acetyltransferase [Caulobacteraceae bacterium]